MTGFADRRDAGERLAARLGRFDPADTVVVALPRGGVPVGAAIADQLRAPLDVLLVRKIGAPGHRELAVGAVSDGAQMDVTVNDDIAAELGLDHEAIMALAERELPQIEQRRALYRGDRPPIPIENKVVILVDDGVATGATAREALRVLRARQPARIVLALPVAPTRTLEMLGPLADETICLAQPEPFVAVGKHYADFRQVDDDEVVRALDRFGAAADRSTSQSDATGTG